MDTPGTLKFDQKKVNTDLGMKYLMENNEIHPILNDYKSSDYGCSLNVIDGHSYKLFSVPISNEELKRCALNFEWQIKSSDILSKTLRKLSKLVEKNAELFAQLEFMTRKIPVDDTKSQIWLIAQNLLCCGKKENWIIEDGLYGDYYVLSMTGNTPLLGLGCVAQIADEKACLLIAATKETAIVCHLFTKLCCQVGLNGINYVFMENVPENLQPGIPKVHIECMTGTTGVITEKGDIDSAVDVFLTSTTTSPWRIHRILVQECIYDAFKNTVEWKCGLKSTKLNQTASEFKKKCTDVFAYDEKVLLVDYAGSEDTATTDPQLIFVEAYRTTKELISLIKFYNVHYMSLWSNHISEANEVAFNTPVPIVWINDYGRFHGPPKVSQALYSRICTIEKKINIPNYDIVNAHKSWMSLGLDERREILSNTLEIFISNYTNMNSSVLVRLQNALINWVSDQIVDVSKDKLCVCVDLPVGIVMSQRFMDRMPFFRSLVSGNAVIFYGLAGFSPLLEALQAAGVPVAEECDCDETSPKVKVICDQMFVTRVVWTNFETIFAN